MKNPGEKPLPPGEEILVPDRNIWPHLEHEKTSITERQQWSWAQVLGAYLHRHFDIRNPSRPLPFYPQQLFVNKQPTGYPDRFATIDK